MSINKTLLSGLVAGSVLAYIQQRIVPVSYISVKKGSILPKSSTKGSAGYDLAVPEDVTLEPGEKKIVDLGFVLAVPRGYYISLQTRSSCSIKEGLILSNGTEGVIDSDYRGTIKLGLRNTSDKTIVKHRGDRVAQMLFKRYQVPVKIVPEVFEFLFGAHRNGRKGGLGSTGK